MASCKENCLFYEVCEWPDGCEYLDSDNLEEDCGKFKNKADFVEVIHGFWVDMKDIAYHCSICGKSFVVEQGTAEMNYCPECGAKMDAKERGGEK